MCREHDTLCSMKKILLLLGFILYGLESSMTYAQKNSVPDRGNGKKERTIYLRGHVKESFTKVGIPDVKITLMRTDSSMVDSMTVWFNDDPRNQTKADASYRFTIPARPTSYIIRAQHPDYEDCYINYTIKSIARNTYFNVPWHYMKKRDSSIDMEGLLNEVTVKATKIKMVYRGDTIVYNADAFNLPQGSMLETLIRQLPGVELKDNGEILVNGRKVDNLTLNGKDFFKGNNKVMLENLPYYTVKNVRVYNKRTERSEWLGRDVEQKEYTMDITMKREYAQGYLGNAELAGGTEERYMGRLFGMRFTDNSRLTVFGNMNNVNETRRPGEKGEWTPENNPQYEETVKKAGADLMIDDKDKRWLEKATVDFNWNHTDEQVTESRESFLSSGHNFSRTMQNDINTNKVFSAQNEFTWLKPFRLDTRISASYAEGKSRNISRSGSFNADPSVFGTPAQVLDSLFADGYGSALSGISVNRQKTEGLQYNKELNLMGEISLNYKLKNGDDIFLQYQGDYSNRQREEYTHYRLDYLQSTDAADDRNTFSDLPRNKYKYRAEAKYTLHWPSAWNSGFYYIYEQEYASQSDDYYRLERFENWQSTHQPLGRIPSTQDSLWLCMDAFNSARSWQQSKFNQIGNEQYIAKEWDQKHLWLYIDLPLAHREERLTYRSAQTDTCLSQRQWQFSPLINFQYYTHNYTRKYWANYSVEIATPSLHSKVNVRDDRNPLAVSLGNPNLKGTVTHTFSAQFTYRKPEKDMMLQPGIDGTVVRNAVSNGFTYNPETGIYTYRPENVDGNRNFLGYLYFTHSLGKKKQWHLRNMLVGDYTRTMEMNAVEGAYESQLNKVNYTKAYEDFTLEYHHHKFDISATGKYTWRHATSTHTDFEHINASEFEYGIIGNVRLPWKLALSTDIKMFSRRGYNEHSMNTDDLVWNASLSRSFLQDKLTFVAEAFDLLNQVSGNYINITGQSIREVHTNALPHYIMLHMKYAFNKIPKKQ